MKLKHKKGLFFLESLIFGFLLMLNFFTIPISAAALQVIANDTGLEIIPSDYKFFEELNLNPGDYIEGTVTIKNENDAPFELFLKTGRNEEGPPLGDADLYRQLQITVTLRGTQIYSGNMSDFANGSGISLGMFEPGAVEVMELAVKLPGEATGNDYQGLKHTNEWVFTAVSKETLPKTGTNINTELVAAIGIIFLFAGIFGVCKFRKTV